MRRLEPGTKLVVASHNPGKVWEIRKLISPFGLEAVSAGDLNLPEPEETESTFEGNARLKGLAAAKAANLPALADDSGLEVACLNGDPGIYSARWAGPGKDFGLAMAKVHKLVTASKGWTSDGPRANFISVLSLAWPDGHTREFTGRIFGHLVWPVRGANGFGYDPMFQADGEQITFGEMDPARKNAISHRARAFAAFEAEALPERTATQASATATAAATIRDAEGLEAAALSISTREEFVRFLANLRQDLKDHPEAWSNASLDAYLNGMGVWSTDATLAEGEPVWRTIARALLAATR